MSIAVSLVIRLLGLFGVSLSPFAAGAIVAGLAIGAVGVGAWRVYDAGFASAESKCEAAALRAENGRLQGRLVEKDRQLAFVNALQQQDAKRAADAEAAATSNQKAIDETPPNPTKCFSRDMARRVRNIR